jgi:hypothetical protein
METKEIIDIVNEVKTKQLDEGLTYKQALKDFKKDILPSIPKNDKPAQRMAWSNYIDSLISNNDVKEKVAGKWGNPF